MRNGRMHEVTVERLTVEFRLEGESEVLATVQLLADELRDSCGFKVSDELIRSTKTVLRLEFFGPTKGVIAENYRRIVRELDRISGLRINATSSWE